MSFGMIESFCPNGRVVLPISGGNVKARERRDAEVPVLLRVEVTGKVVGGSIIVRMPRSSRRTFSRWFRRERDSAAITARVRASGSRPAPAPPPGPRRSCPGRGPPRPGTLAPTVRRHNGLAAACVIIHLKSAFGSDVDKTFDKPYPPKAKGAFFMQTNPPG